MTSTTSSRPATPLQASRLPDNRPVVTEATSGAGALAAARVAVVAGATGLVGRAVLDLLVADRSYSAIHCVGRRAPEVQHHKMVAHLTRSFSGLDLPPVDDVFIAVGTTIKVAGSREAFRAVDFDAVLAIARASRNAGATRLGVVSAMGADSQSRIFYNRVKGEMEDAVARLDFEAIVIARPSLLTGDRDKLSQVSRPVEKISLFAAHWFMPLIPANYRPVHADDVAQALTSAVACARGGVRVMLSSELQSGLKNS